MLTWISKATNISLNFDVLYEKKDLVERDTAEIGEDFSRQPDKKPPHCQWHATVWYGVGDNQGLHIQASPFKLLYSNFFFL